MSFLRRQWQWIIICLFLFLALCFGYWGFSDYFKQQGVSRSFWDTCYFVICLFAMEPTDGSGPDSWQFAVARWLATIVVFYAAAKAVLLVFREHFKEIIIKFFWRGHVVICGMGRKGLRLVEEFRAKGFRVAIIELDGNNKYIARCEAKGAVIIKSDASDRMQLLRAGANKARYVINICGDDGVNIAIVMRLYRLIQEQNERSVQYGWCRKTASRLCGTLQQQASKCDSRLTCIVHVLDPHLCELFRHHDVFRNDTDMLDVRVINVYESAARMLLASHPLEGTQKKDHQRKPHLVVLGFGKMGQSLILQAAKIGHYADGVTVRISVVDRDALRLSNAFFGSYPQYKKICKPEFLTSEITSEETIMQLRNWTQEQEYRATVAICLDDEEESLGAALKIAQHFRGSELPIYFRMSESTGLAALFDENNSISGSLAHLRPFGLLKDISQVKTVIGDELDYLARAIHEEYREERRKQNASANDPAVKPWEYLDPVLRDSNRQQADHISVKLRAINYKTAPLDAPGIPVKEFKWEEIERMSRMEHARWNADRFLAGWTYSKTRDPIKRTSPYLVSWEELPEEIREYDREAVRKIPVLLDLIGKKIIREKEESKI